MVCGSRTGGPNSEQGPENRHTPLLTLGRPIVKSSFLDHSELISRCAVKSNLITLYDSAQVSGNSAVNPAATLLMIIPLHEPPRIVCRLLILPTFLSPICTFPLRFTSNFIFTLQLHDTLGRY